MREKKKVILLAILLAVLGGVIGGNWSLRDQPVPAVKDTTEHQALAAFSEMLEVGRLKGWEGVERFWVSPPDRREQQRIQRLMGSRFRGEFAFQGSAPVEGAPDELELYGNFGGGIPVTARLRKVENRFQVLSIHEM